jgi:hypothetical protein
MGEACNKRRTDEKFIKIFNEIPVGMRLPQQVMDNGRN